MLIGADWHADWCWLILIDADWYDWCWLVLIDSDWCWLILIDADWCWLILIDADWYWLILIRIAADCCWRWCWLLLMGIVADTDCCWCLLMLMLIGADADCCRCWLLLMLWLLAVRPGLTHVKEHHRPSNGHFDLRQEPFFPQTIFGSPTPSANQFNLIDFLAELKYSKKTRTS